MLDTVAVGLTAVTVPVTVVLGNALNVTVAGWLTATFDASASAKAAETTRWAMSEMVMNDDDDDELVDDPDDPEAAPLEPPLPDAPDVPEPELELLVVAPEPLTVWPTVLLTAVTVPETGAVRVVSLRVFWSWVTVAWAWVTAAWSWAREAGLTYCLALIDSWVEVTLLLADVRAVWADVTPCGILLLP